MFEGSPISNAQTPVCAVPSIGIPARKLEASPQHDLEIEPHTPIVDVSEIKIDSLLHQFKLGSLSAEAIHLGPTDDPGFDVLPERVIADSLRIASTALEVLQ